MSCNLPGVDISNLAASIEYPGRQKSITRNSAQFKHEGFQLECLTMAARPEIHRQLPTFRRLSSECNEPRYPVPRANFTNKISTNWFSTFHRRFLNSPSIGFRNLYTCRTSSWAHRPNEFEAGKSRPCHFHTDQLDIAWLSGPRCPRRLHHREHRPLVFWATFCGQTSGTRKSGTHTDTWDSRADYPHQCLAARGACCCSRGRTVALVLR